MDGSFVLYLIRHLETAANREKRYVGWTDVPVCTDAGPVGFRPDLITGSDLIRCRQTAAHLFPGQVYRPDADFRECHFGDWEMKTYEYLKSIPAYRRWITDPAVRCPPGGERFSEIEARLDKGLVRLRERAGIHSAAVVSHGGPIRLMLSKLAPAETPFNDWVVPAGSLHVLRWADKTQWEAGARCTFFSAEPITENGNM